MNETLCVPQHLQSLVCFVNYPPLDRFGLDDGALDLESARVRSFGIGGFCGREGSYCAMLTEERPLCSLSLSLALTVFSYLELWNIQEERFLCVTPSIFILCCALSGLQTQIKLNLLQTFLCLQCTFIANCICVCLSICSVPWLLI